jgi:acyl carrier protein
MNNQDLFDAVQASCVTVLGVGADEVTRTANLREDLGADSLDMAELVMALEDRVGVSIPDGSLAGVVTVQDAITVVESCVERVAS